MFRLRNPIQEAERDPKKVAKFFEDLKLVPFAGRSQSTSHAYMKLLCDVSRLSPSAQACKRDISSFAFEGDIDIATRKVPGFVEDRQPVADAQKRMVADTLIEHGIDFMQVQSISVSGYENMADTGNNIIYAKIAQVNGVAKVFLETIHPLYCAYLWTTPDEPRTLIIVHDWDTKTWEEHPPTMVETENWTQKEPGVMHRVFHFKNDHAKDGCDWYGRPSDEANIVWKFSEFSQGELTSKISATEFVTKTLLAFEAEAPEEDEDDTEETKDKEWKQKVYTVKRLITNKGDHGEAESLAMMEYQHGTAPPESITLEVNRDTKYHKFTLSEAASKIYSGYGWYQELTGAMQTGAGIGSNILIDLFKVADQKVITKLQERKSHEWDIMLGSIWDQLEKPDMKQYSYVFPNNIEQLIEKLMPADQNKTEDANPADGI